MAIETIDTFGLGIQLQLGQATAQLAKLKKQIETTKLNGPSINPTQSPVLPSNRPTVPQSSTALLPLPPQRQTPDPIGKTKNTNFTVFSKADSTGKLQEKNTSQIASNIASIKRDSNGVGKISVNSNDVRGSSAVASNVGKIRDNIKDIAKFGVGLAIFNTGVKFIKDIPKQAKDFETAQSKVVTALGATIKQGEVLKSQARQIGKTTIFSANEVSSAQLVLAKNGLDFNKITGGSVEASLNLAGALSAQLAPAADLVTDAIVQFGLKASDSETISNQITGTALRSKASFDDLRLAFGQAGGIAGKVGVDFADFNAVIAGTISAFSGGSDAGTSFKTFLASLTPTGKKQKKLIQELGLEFFDTAGNMRSMSEIAGELNQVFSGLNEEQKLSTAQTIFGRDAARTAITLADFTAESFDSLKESIAEVNAEEVAIGNLGATDTLLRKISSKLAELKLIFNEAFASTGVNLVLTLFDKLLSVMIAIPPEIYSIIAGIVALRVASIALAATWKFIFGAGAIANLKKIKDLIKGVGIATAGATVAGAAGAATGVGAATVAGATAAGATTAAVATKNVGKLAKITSALKKATSVLRLTTPVGVATTVVPIIYVNREELSKRGDVTNRPSLGGNGASGLSTQEELTKSIAESARIRAKLGTIEEQLARRKELNKITQTNNITQNFNGAADRQQVADGTRQGLDNATERLSAMP